MGYEVDFQAVGEGEKSGDAIAVRFGNLHCQRSEQTVVVIDGGYVESGESLVQHIRKFYHTEDVDLVISTHPDADHTNGLRVVLEQLRVKTLWMHRPWNHTSDIAEMFFDDTITDKDVRDDLRKSLEAARKLETLALRMSIPIVEPFAGTSDPSGRILVVGPSEKFYEGLLPTFRCNREASPLLGLLSKAFETGRDWVTKIAEGWNIETLTDDGETSAENNSSAIIFIQADIGKGLLFTADSGMPALMDAADYLLSRGITPDMLSLLQVPHHGSQRNVGPTILNRLVGPILPTQVQTKVAYVSAAKDGEPKHPCKKVTNAFLRRGAPVHATQGMSKCHYYNAPRREGWNTVTPLPFYFQVEE